MNDNEFKSILKNPSKEYLDRIINDLISNEEDEIINREDDFDDDSDDDFDESLSKKSWKYNNLLLK